MRFESEWPGDIIAAPICRTYDREDMLFDSLADRSWNQLDSPSERTEGRCAETATTDLAGWRASITSIASVVAELWSRMLRGREIRRIRASWEAIDDRTLKDIGISRYEIEYARDPRHWS
jgi:uncharacterized protein YjiS (DUF1127 family)